MKVGTGDKTTTNWPGEPTQPPSQADQIITDATDPGRVYYVATDELGNFYVGEYFKVDQATGTATLNSSAFNLSGLESLQLGAIGGLIGASINEFSTDGTMSQNSNAKCPTQAAVRTYVASQTQNLNSTSATFSGNVSIGGTLTYQDVTNVDSVGIITANSDIHVGVGLSVVGVSTFTGQLNAGVIAATGSVTSGGKALATMGKAVAMAMVFG